MIRILQKMGIAALKWAGYAIILLIFIGIPSYFAFQVGRMVGHGIGFRGCMEQTIFPSKSELDKVKRYFE